MHVLIILGETTERGRICAFNESADIRCSSLHVQLSDCGDSGPGSVCGNVKLVGIGGSAASFAPLQNGPVPGNPVPLWQKSTYRSSRSRIQGERNLDKISFSLSEVLNSLKSSWDLKFLLVFDLWQLLARDTPFKSESCLSGFKSSQPPRSSSCRTIR